MKHVAIRAALAACCLGPGTGGASAQAAGCGLFEAVEPGDTFAVISQRCGVPVDTLVAANPGIDAAAPPVANTLSLALPAQAGTVVAGVTVTPQPPAPQVVVVETEKPAPPAQVVVIETATPAPPAIEASVLAPLLGRWTPAGAVCADPDAAWMVEQERLLVGGETCALESVVLTQDVYVLGTVCGSNGVTVARDFSLQVLDALTVRFATGEQEGVLSRCAPG